MDEVTKSLLAFAESIANHRMGNMHGMYHKEVQEARRVVKLAGGKLKAIGRYRENEVEPMSWDDYAIHKYKKGKS